VVEKQGLLPRVAHVKIYKEDFSPKCNETTEAVIALQTTCEITLAAIYMTR
jgi:hypothetical protein